MSGEFVAVKTSAPERVMRPAFKLVMYALVRSWVGGWVNKGTSITQYCGKIALSPDHVNRVAATTHTLINELSAAKDRQMDRDRIVSLFDQGVSLLQDIVLLVDRDRLRSVSK